MNSRLSNIEFLRSFAVLSLVAWHSLCVYVGWQSYLPDITDAVGHSFLTKLYGVLTTRVFTPDANMPLFTVISGFVYAYLRKQGKYQDTTEFVKKKAKRLMIPYFVIGTLVVLTIADWSPISIVFGDAHHLWYCAMLFWCFVYIRIFEKIPNYLIILGVLIGVGFQFVLPPYDLFGIAKGVKYFPYFVMGYYLVDYLPKIQIGGGKIIAIVSWLLCMIAAILTKWNVLFVMLNYLFVLMLFAVVPQDIKVGNLLRKISAYSFGIYVFHEWFLWNMAHIDALHSFIIEHQILYPIIAYVSIFSISLVLTELSLKTKVGRFLLVS